MKTVLDDLKSLTQKQLEELQQQNPDTIIMSSISQETSDAYAQTYEMRQKHPILKHTAGSLRFNNLLESKARDQQKFIDQFKGFSLRDALNRWLNEIQNPDTQRNYVYYIEDMIRRFPAMFPECISSGDSYTIDDFSRENHKKTLDCIKEVAEWSEGTRQLRIACYLSFTAYLEKITDGWFPRIRPLHLMESPTFYRTSNRRATERLALSEWHQFIKALNNISKRDSLIARCIFHSTNISAVLNLTLDQIDFEQCTITFSKEKGGNVAKQILAKYPPSFLDELREYIKSTSVKRKNSRLVFITRNGKKLTRSRCNYVFAMASKTANIKKVTPYILRTTWTFLTKEQGVQEGEIMKIKNR